MLVSAVPSTWEANATNRMRILQIKSRAASRNFPAITDKSALGSERNHFVD